ncbi:hypothetical protein Tsubulata_016925 [Turnera subulata]|uniref:Uncharacterized protein n=1 Tax=Turnera subulata TaxID=218843 RepID=A0A9Q0G3A1_9ROSI|nr:hypothetical protein Tsubulata_016925 [Turnera subulata]
MDCFLGKKKSNRCERGARGLAEKVRLLREEIKSVMYEREEESKAYERDMMLFAFKEAEWKQERKKLKEEVKRLRKIVEEKEEKIQGMEDDLFLVKTDHQKDEQLVMASKYSFFVEQMREERLWRDEAVEKWKKLYLDIKTELDDLIQRTNPGGGLYLRAEEEDMIEELKMDLKTKDQTIEKLKARIALAEHEEYKKAREVDILRQSLKIVSSKKAYSLDSTKPKWALIKHARKAQC